MTEKWTTMWCAWLCLFTQDIHCSIHLDPDPDCNPDCGPDNFCTVSTGFCLSHFQLHILCDLWASCYDCHPALYLSLDHVVSHLSSAACVWASFLLSAWCWDRKTIFATVVFRALSPLLLMCTNRHAIRHMLCLFTHSKSICWFKAFHIFMTRFWHLHMINF